MKTIAAFGNTDGGMLLIGVDDDKNILEVLKLRLESNGYNVFAAVNSDSALNMAKTALFDLALVDLKIGDEDHAG